MCLGDTTDCHNDVCSDVAPKEERDNRNAARVRIAAAPEYSTANGDGEIIIICCR